MSHQRWVRAEEVLWRYTEAGVVLLPREAEEPVLLGGSGAKIWELLTEPLSLSELTDRLAGIYAVEPASIENDVHATLTELDAVDAVIRIDRHENH